MLAIVAIRALAWVGVAAFVRAWPWPGKWREVKPLSCDACMVVWGAIETLTFWCPVVWPSDLEVLSLLASYGLGWVLLHVARGIGPTPGLGDLLKGEETTHGDGERS